MPTEAEMVDNATTTKHNLTGNDDSEELLTDVFRERLRVWMKRDRIKVDGVETDVIIPFNLFIEPFHETGDIDTDITTGQYDESNERYRLYSELNGNYKLIQSKTIHLVQNKSVRSIFMSVDAKDLTEANAGDRIELEVYNGNEWIAIKNGIELFLGVTTGADLDADLPADLYSSYDNRTAGTVAFTDNLTSTTYKDPDATTATWDGSGTITF